MGLIAAADIARMLADRIDELVPAILPAAVRDGHEWRVGSCAGERGTSMGIHRDGPRRGVWCDFSADTMRGDALDLVAHVLFGGDKKRAFAWARSWLGLDGMDPGRLQQVRRDVTRKAQAADREAQQEAKRRARRAKAIWLNASKELSGGPVDLYLRGRGISIADMPRPPGSLRCAAALDYLPDEYGEIKSYPAMVAAVVRWDAKTGGAAQVAVHRTYLHSPHGGVYKKAPVPRPKLVLGGFRGGFIPLARGASGKRFSDAPPGDHVLISEGVEDGLSAAVCLPDCRVIAGVAANNFINIELPRAMAKVTVLRQNKDAPGSEAHVAIERALDRFDAEGRAVCEYWPPEGFDDINDYLQARTAAAAGAA